MGEHRDDQRQQAEGAQLLKTQTRHAGDGYAGQEVNRIPQALLRSHTIQQRYHRHGDAPDEAACKPRRVRLHLYGYPDPMATLPRLELPDRGGRWQHRLDTLNRQWYTLDPRLRQDSSPPADGADQ